MNLRSASFLATAVLAFAYPAFAAAPPSLSGQWAIHISVAGTEKDLACTFVQADNKLTGNCTGDDKPHPITGTVDGANVTWTYDSDYNGTAITLTYTATLTDAPNFSGSLDIQPFNVSGEFTAAPSTEPAKTPPTSH
jgi:hypothetical protein